MKWYGLSTNIYKNKTIKDKKKFKKKTKKIAFFRQNFYNLNFYKIKLHIPFPWNFIVIKNHKIFNTFRCFLYSPVYFFSFSVPFSFLTLKCSANSKNLFFQFMFKNFFNPTFWSYLQIIFFSFSKIFFRKLKFKGKGYYIYKNQRNTISLQMGYSHIVRLYSFFVNVRFLTKTSIFIFGINKLNIEKSGYSLLQLKPINIFTGKGIRFNRQILYRKTGKISSYR